MKHKVNSKMNEARALKKAGYTIEEIAKRLGLKPSTVRKIWVF